MKWSPLLVIIISGGLVIDWSYLSQVDWDVCPPDLPCCNEYGYCRSRVAHHYQQHQYSTSLQYPCENILQYLTGGVINVPSKSTWEIFLNIFYTGGVELAEFPGLQRCEQWNRITRQVHKSIQPIFPLVFLFHLVQPFFLVFFRFLSQLVSVVYFVWSGRSSPIMSDWHEHWALIFSVLELENALGGDPGPGLGADSDFDKRQLEKVKLSWLAVRHQTDVIVMID